jgi:hypothetical protein
MASGRRRNEKCETDRKITEGDEITGTTTLSNYYSETIPMPTPVLLARYAFHVSVYKNRQGQH